MSTQPSDMTVHSFRTDFYVSGNLSVCHPANGFHDDHGIEVGTLLPIGLGESLRAKTSFAGFACKPLDTERWLVSSEKADFFVRPEITIVVVVKAVRVWAEGRNP